MGFPLQSTKADRRQGPVEAQSSSGGVTLGAAAPRQGPRGPQLDESRDIRSGFVCSLTARCSGQLAEIGQVTGHGRPGAPIPTQANPRGDGRQSSEECHPGCPKGDRRSKSLVGFRPHIPKGDRGEVFI